MNYCEYELSAEHEEHGLIICDAPASTKHSGHWYCDIHYEYVSPSEQTKRNNDIERMYQEAEAQVTRMRGYRIEDMEEL